MPFVLPLVGAADQGFGGRVVFPDMIDGTDGLNEDGGKPSGSCNEDVGRLDSRAINIMT